MKTEKKKKKDEKPNQLEKLVLNITEPFKMDSEIELKQLSVFVGDNNSGKSFMLKLAFAMGSVGAMKLAPPDPNSAAQFVFDNTFTDQKFEGLFKAVYTHGLVAVEMKEGKVVKVEMDGDASPVTFMSSDMRTFDQMAMYLRIRKDAKGDTLSFMQEMLKVYRLYDLTYMEGLLSKMPFVLSENAKDLIKSMISDHAIASIEVDLDKCEFLAVLEDGKKVNIVTFGKGYQAVLNMAIGMEVM